MLNNIASMLGAGSAAVGDYESIATIAVGVGGVASVSFTSIPSTYTHLQIRFNARVVGAGSVNDNVLMQVNSDTGSNYNAHYLYGSGTSALAGATGTASTTYVGRAPQASATGGVYSGQVLDLLDYSNTNKYKTFRSLSGADLNGSGDIFLWSGLWMNTNAINTILIKGASSNLSQYSSFALYGIK
jgi:hypothetical protein